MLNKPTVNGAPQCAPRRGGDSAPVLRGVTRITGPFSARGLLAHVFFSPATFLVRVGCAHCARFLYLDVPRAARVRAGRPCGAVSGHTSRYEPQLSFRLSREMASLVSGIAGVEVLVKPCVGHAWKADAVSGEDETGARGRGHERGSSRGHTHPQQRNTQRARPVDRGAQRVDLAPCLAQGELLGNGVQGE